MIESYVKKDKQFTLEEVEKNNSEEKIVSGDQTLTWSSTVEISSR